MAFYYDTEELGYELGYVTVVRSEAPLKNGQQTQEGSGVVQYWCEGTVKLASPAKAANTAVPENSNLVDINKMMVALCEEGSNKDVKSHSTQANTIVIDYIGTNFRLLISPKIGGKFSPRVKENNLVLEKKNNQNGWESVDPTGEGYAIDGQARLLPVAATFPGLEQLEDRYTYTSGNLAKSSIRIDARDGSHYFVISVKEGTVTPDLQTAKAFTPDGKLMRGVKIDPTTFEVTGLTRATNPKRKVVKDAYHKQSDSPLASFLSLFKGRKTPKKK